ncbi:RNA polymerase sigma factor [Streptomyces qaidamensis]|uniref:RNA polymerase sigma factor n=1 Tax=Streptomyces qaidamensis TaxID=1783515 RepID=UPI00365C87D1
MTSAESGDVEQEDASKAPLDLANPAEFERFYQAHYGQTVACARRAHQRYGLAIDETEDLAQVAWASLWAGRDRVKKIENPIGYLRAIIYKLASTAAKREITTRQLLAALFRTDVSGLAAIFDDESVAGSTVHDLTVRRHQPIPEQTHESRENLARLTRVLRQMPLTYREALALHTDGYDGQERAEVRGVRPGTDRQHLLRGRLTGQRLIKEQAPDLAREGEE